MSTPVTTVGCAVVLAALFALILDGVDKATPVPLPRPRPPEAPIPEYEFSRWAKPVATTSFVQTAALQPGLQPTVVVRSALQRGQEADEAGRGTARLPHHRTPTQTRHKGTPPSAREEIGWRAVAKDICRGKGRVFTNNGKSWRCRRD